MPIMRYAVVMLLGVWLKIVVRQPAAALSAILKGY